ADFDWTDTIFGGGGNDEIDLRDTVQVGDDAFAHVFNVGSVRLRTDAPGQTVTLGANAQAAGIRQARVRRPGGVTPPFANGVVIDASAMTVGMTLSGAGPDTLIGGSGNDTFGFQGTGNLLVGGSIDGGLGFNSIFLNHARADYRITANAGIIGVSDSVRG